MPVLFSFTTCSHWGWYHVFTQLYPCKHKWLHIVGCILTQFFTWLKLLEMKMWGKTLEEIIWRSSAIECKTGSWWNFSRIVLNSKPQQVTGIDIQTSYMLNKNKQTKTKQTKTKTTKHASLFQKLWGILLPLIFIIIGGVFWGFLTSKNQLEVVIVYIGYV